MACKLHSFGWWLLIFSLALHIRSDHSQYILYLLGAAVFYVTFHPLARFPGPRLWAISQMPHVFYTIKGTLIFKVAELHKKYGLVIRTRPNELSYITANAWKDIYSGKAQLPKYDATLTKRPPGTKESIFLVISSDDHARMTKNLNPGFSEKALREQEPRIMKYVGLLIHRLIMDHSRDGRIDICSVAMDSSNALLSADFNLIYQGVPATPLSLSLHEGCNHNGVIASVRRVASA